jgi:hypothetical protein
MTSRRGNDGGLSTHRAGSNGAGGGAEIIKFLPSARDAALATSERLIAAPSFIRACGPHPIGRATGLHPLRARNEDASLLSPRAPFKRSEFVQAPIDIGVAIFWIGYLLLVVGGIGFGLFCLLFL